jgi:hypothetical protein
MAKKEEDVPMWLKYWFCPACDDGMENMPCECFDIMEASERWANAN